MSLDFFIGSVSIGLMYALVSLGVYISFRLLDFPDLTADGSFPLGGAVCGVMLYLGFNPLIAMLFATLAGCIAGSITALLFTKLHILQLLASIIVMIGLYSINLRIAGLGTYLDGSNPIYTASPNLPLLGIDTIFTSLQNWVNNEFYTQAIIMIIIVAVAGLFLTYFLMTKIGLALRASGTNTKMAKAQGISTNTLTVLGMAISNGLIALGGALFIQTTGSADTTIGLGTIVIGLASIILGESLFHPKRIFAVVLAVIVGAVLYRIFIAFVLANDTLRSFGVDQSDTNLITAIVLVIALVLPKYLSKKVSFSKSK